jgi:membrane fusion protein, multidrug efflux system
MFMSRIAAAALIAATIAGCDKTTAPISEARPVRAVSVRQGAEGEIVSLTGQLRAKDEAALAFRLDGRMIERPVHVGDRLAAGQVVARLDPQIQQNALRSRVAEKLERMFRLGYSAQFIGGRAALRHRISGTCIT